MLAQLWASHGRLCGRQQQIRRQRCLLDIVRGAWHAATMRTRITHAELADDQSSVTVSFDASGEVITLRMDVRLMSELMDTAAALNDEAMRRNASQIAGMNAGAYRNSRTANVALDATLSKVLVDFDRGAPHR